MENAGVQTLDTEALDVESADIESRDIESRDIESRDIESRHIQSADIESRDIESSGVEESTGSARSSRRTFFQSAARAGGGLAALAVVGGGLAACDVVADVDDPLIHLLKRATFGVSTWSLQRHLQIGRDAWLAEQLDPTRLDLTAIDAKVRKYPAVGMSIAQLAQSYRGNGREGAASIQLQIATAMRQVESPAQLHERMVEFWSDHLNVPMLDENLRLLKIVEDREVIRPNALRSFRDLLLASASSPAMLVYLDGGRSFKGAINENYSRELLELHTVGVNGGYTEADVVALARLLTGRTVNPQTGQFAFDPVRHDPEPLTIMGWQRPVGGSGYEHGQQFLSWLAAHPKTAAFIATKLVRRFVSDVPDASLVDQLASVYLANDTAIVPVLRAMFAHPSFEAAKRKKFRRPHDFLIGSLRAVGGTFTAVNTDAVNRSVGALAVGLGQPPFLWPAPNGYPDVEGAWLTSGGLLSRWNAAGDIVSNAVPGLSVDPGPLREGLAGKPIEQCFDLLTGRVLREPLTTQGRTLLHAHTGLQPGTIVSEPLAQRLVPRVVPFLLSSADFQYR